MKNLKPTLSGKTLADLKSLKTTGGSNLVEPTKTEIDSIITALLKGKTVKEIRTTIRRKVGTAMLGFSPDQIKMIEKAVNEKRGELQPKTEPKTEPKIEPNIV